MNDKNEVSKSFQQNDFNVDNDKKDKASENDKKGDNRDIINKNQS